MSRSVSVLSVVVGMMVTVLAMVAVAFAAEDEGGQGQQKFPLCHKGHTITVGAPAVTATCVTETSRALAKPRCQKRPGRC
jgi:hypothetical protein